MVRSGTTVMPRSAHEWFAASDTVVECGDVVSLQLAVAGRSGGALPGWRQQRRQHCGRPTNMVATFSNLPLQVLVYFNGWYDVVYVAIMLVLYIWKASALPYPGELGGMLALEICLVLLLGVLEYCRLFLASRGNKTERPTPLLFSCVVALPCVYLFFYFIFQQIYVTRLDLILGLIGIVFLGLELIIGLLVAWTMLRAPQQPGG